MYDVMIYDYIKYIMLLYMTYLFNMFLHSGGIKVKTSVYTLQESCVWFTQSEHHFLSSYLHNHKKYWSQFRSEDLLSMYHVADCVSSWPDGVEHCFCCRPLVCETKKRYFRPPWYNWSIGDLALKYYSLSSNTLCFIIFRVKCQMLTSKSCRYSWSSTRLCWDLSTTSYTALSTSTILHRLVLLVPLLQIGLSWLVSE